MKTSRRIAIIAAREVKRLVAHAAMRAGQAEHNGIPPDFELLMYGDTREWFEATA